MHGQSLISRFRPGSIFALSLFACLFLLNGFGPGSTQGFAAQVTLAWDANTDPSVTGYKLYYGYATRSYGAPVNIGKVTQYTLTGIQEGINCYFAVTAYDANGNESAFSTELECFTLVPASVVNGTISPSSAVVASRGMNLTFTITPSANYEVSTVTVDGASVGAVSSYTFSNVTASHSISASFAAVSSTYTISASAGANGAVSPSGNVSVSQGGSQFIIIIPNAGFQVQDVLVDGVSVGAVTSYTFSNVTASHTISATFAPFHSQSGPLTSFNGDDKPDILWRNTSTGQNAVLYMNGVRATGADFLPAVADPNWTIAGVDDFNGDGDPDILWRNASSGQNAVWYMNGVTVTGVDFLPDVADPNWTIAGVGDFNGDGDPDILWRNASSGQNAVWYMNGVTVTGEDLLPDVADPNWTIAGVGDFNGDGDSDILWRNASSGQNAVLYMNGARATGADFLPAVADPNWTIAGVGDYNGDGDPDILWRNTSTGQNAVLYMNGATVTGVDFLLTVADPNWRIY